MALQSNNSFHMWQKKTLLTIAMIHHLLSYITDNPSTAMHLCGENHSPLFRRPPDAPLLVLKTQPSWLLCHSCMRSCILRSWASQAHTCPTETTSLKQQREKQMHDLWNIWILKLFDEPKAAMYQPTINDSPNSGGRPKWPVFCPVMATPATGGQMSNIFVLLHLFKAGVTDEDSSSRGKETAIFCMRFVYTANTCCAHSRCAAECQNHSHVFTCNRPAAVLGLPRLREQKHED